MAKRVIVGLTNGLTAIYRNAVFHWDTGTSLDIWTDDDEDTLIGVHPDGHWTYAMEDEDG